MNTAASAKAQMVAKLQARSTEQLLSDLTVLESQMDGFGTPEQRIAKETITDVIEAREDLSERLEAVFMDYQWHGTYGEALKLAYAAKKSNPA